MTFIYVANCISFLILSFNITTEAFFIITNVSKYPLLNSKKDNMCNIATLVCNVINGDIDIVEDKNGEYGIKQNN